MSIVLNVNPFQDVGSAPQFLTHSFISRREPMYWKMYIRITKKEGAGRIFLKGVGEGTIGMLLYAH
jgi:hypothetical protein